MFAWVTAHLWPPPPISKPALGIPWPFSAYARYDAGFFMRIAHDGYFSRGVDDVRVAFFPGYPLGGRFLATILGLGNPTAIDWFVAFSAVAWAGAAIGAVLMWRYVADNATNRAATISVVALLAGPYSLFLMAPYSEGPFLALSLGAWLCAGRRHWTRAGVFCGLAALVRINALFLLGGVLVRYLQDVRRRDQPARRGEFLPLLLPLVSVGGYFAWLRVRTGHWNAWFRAQRVGWFRRTRWP